MITYTSVLWLLSTAQPHSCDKIDVYILCPLYSSSLPFLHLIPSLFFLPPPPSFTLSLPPSLPPPSFFHSFSLPPFLPPLLLPSLSLSLPFPLPSFTLSVTPHSCRFLHKAWTNDPKPRLRSGGNERLPTPEKLHMHCEYTVLGHLVSKMSTTVPPLEAA